MLSPLSSVKVTLGYPEEELLNAAYAVVSSYKVTLLPNPYVLLPIVHPVYVDNNGNIVKSNGNVGSKNVSMYLNSGVLTRGMTFYTSTSAPSSTDKAEDGDIWIQYV